MSSSTTDPCPHDRRPGTTVCLHCRHAEREAVRARRRRTFTRLAVRGLALGLVGVLGVRGLGALEGKDLIAQLRTTVSNVVARASAATRAAPRAPARAAPATPPADSNRATAVQQVVLPTLPQPTPDTALAAAQAVVQTVGGEASDQPPSDSVAPAPAAQMPPPPLAPIVAEGQTALRDGLFATRAGDTVAVHFDTPLARTRRPEKFEQIVRATLPAVYGPTADSLLATIPEGKLALAGDLITELPTRGLHLPIGAGWSLALWPETRQGQDGPLVVTYRAVVVR